MTFKKLLVIVDMQSDFIGGSLGFPGAQAVVEAVVEKINQIKQEPAWGIVVTYDTHAPTYLASREGGALPVLHCVKPSPGWQLDPAIEAALATVNCLRVEKPSFGLPAERMLEVKAVFGEAIEEIHLCGLVSNICVLSNAIVFQANYPEATLVLDANTTASFSDELNEATLKVLRGLQVQVNV